MSAVSNTLLGWENRQMRPIYLDQKCGFQVGKIRQIRNVLPKKVLFYTSTNKIKKCIGKYSSRSFRCTMWYAGHSSGFGDMGLFRSKSTLIRKKIEIFCPKKYSSPASRIKSKNASESTLLALSDVLFGMWHTRLDLEIWYFYGKNRNNSRKVF